MEDLIFYGFCVLMVIVGFWLVKKVVGCLLRSAIALIIIAIVAYVYFNYYA